MSKLAILTVNYIALMEMIHFNLGLGSLYGNSTDLANGLAKLRLLTPKPMKLSFYNNKQVSCHLAMQ